MATGGNISSVAISIPVTAGCNNQSVAFGDTGDVNNQPVALTDTGGVNNIFVAFYSRAFSATDFGMTGQSNLMPGQLPGSGYASAPF